MSGEAPEAPGDPSAEVLAHVREALEDGPDAWIVGGAVRDRLLGRPTADLDLAVASTDAEVLRGLARGITRRAGGHAFPLSDVYGAWRACAPADAPVAWQVDLTPLQGADLAEDLGRRDLTVNAIAEPIAGGTLVDPFGGEPDLRARRLRAVGPESFSSDPVRVLRLARFAAELDAAPDAATVAAAARSAPALAADVPGERTLPELSRTLTGPGWRRGLTTAEAVGALAALVPHATTAGGALRPDVAAVLARLLGDDPRLPEAAAEHASALAAITAGPDDRLVLALAALVRPAPDPGRALDRLRPSRELRAAVVRTAGATERIAGLRTGPTDPDALFAALGPAGTRAPHAVLLARAVLGPEDLPWPPLAARAVRWAAGPPRPPVAGEGQRAT
ncbi:hypothetical protein AB0L40_18010, partial [Patulibacter sp. NPDC049589]|uniref:hypothetical protein n=1 Tax=Patulibacter sp. NPDC049589 TaxID=3154731 RepID=UPI003434F00E